MGIGPTELIIVLVIVLVIFGPKRLPALAKSLGGGIRELKDSIGGKDDEDDDGEGPSVTRAQTALGRPDEAAGTATATTTTTTATASPDVEPVPERR
ncbi:MAG TPA: twin-arginine translocase TatA/TatE family subunit [Solirubrobacteraceae bacterium]|jgi:sec-independent protein translocase protein TatA